MDASSESIDGVGFLISNMILMERSPSAVRPKSLATHFARRNKLYRRHLSSQSVWFLTIYARQLLCRQPDYKIHGKNELGLCVVGELRQSCSLWTFWHRNKAKFCFVTGEVRQSFSILMPYRAHFCAETVTQLLSCRRGKAIFLTMTSFGAIGRQNFALSQGRRLFNLVHFWCPTGHTFFVLERSKSCRFVGEVRQSCSIWFFGTEARQKFAGSREDNLVHFWCPPGHHFL